MPLGKACNERRSAHAESLLNSDEVAGCPEIPDPVDERGGGECRFAQGVHMHEAELAARLDDVGFAVVVREEDLAVEGDRRRGEAFLLRFAEAPLVEDL